MKQYPAIMILLVAGCGFASPAGGPSTPVDGPGQTSDVPVGNIDMPFVSEESDTDVDQDADGLTLAEELFFGTSDLFADTDFDGLSDFDEVMALGTDPLSTDTDSDGLEDFEEIHVHGTSPTLSDSDFDGLSDLEEVRFFGTDPLYFDSDSDGLADGEEVGLGTDPRNPDTDGDGISDFDELVNSTNPLDPTDPPPPIVPGDFFSFLNQEQADILRSMQAAGILRASQVWATCQARAQADCASRGISENCQFCSCDRLGWEISIQEFEDALLDQIGYTMTSVD